MYDKSQIPDPTEQKPVAFRGSFLMSPRVPLFVDQSGAFYPGSQPPPPKENGKPNRKHYVLFSRN